MRRGGRPGSHREWWRRSGGAGRSRHWEPWEPVGRTGVGFWRPGRIVRAGTPGGLGGFRMIPRFRCRYGRVRGGTILPGRHFSLRAGPRGLEREPDETHGAPGARSEAFCTIWGRGSSTTTDPQPRSPTKPPPPPSSSASSLRPPTGAAPRRARPSPPRCPRWRAFEGAGKSAHTSDEKQTFFTVARSIRRPSGVAMGRDPPSD